MAYDEALAERVRSLLESRADYGERRMFGGIAFMLGGRMCCGVLGPDLVARIGPAGYAAALQTPHVRPMDFTGRPMKGYVYVGPGATRSRRGLADWVERSIAFTASLAAPRVARKRRQRS